MYGSLAIAAKVYCSATIVAAEAAVVKAVEVGVRSHGIFYMVYFSFHFFIRHHPGHTHTYPFLKP